MTMPFRVLPTCGEYLVLVGRQFRQLLQERHHVPDTFIVMPRSPGGHARGLDAMFNNPELSFTGLVVIFGVTGMIVSMFITR